MTKTLAVLAALLLCAGIAAGALAAGSVGTVSACATTPAQTISVNGSPVSTVPESTACSTSTYTIPTVTQTVTVTDPGTTTTAPTTTVASPTFGIWRWDVQSLPIDPNSAAFVSSMLSSTPNSYVAAMEGVAHRTPSSSVYERHGTSIDGLDANFWIPDGSLPGLSTDHHFAVVDDVTGRTTDMWKATLGTDGKIDTWKGGRTYPTSPVVAYLPQMVKSGANTTTNASNVPALPSMLTPADVKAGIADHTLTFTLYHPGPGVATATTRGNRYPAAPYATPWPGITTNPPLGTMIRLPVSATLSSAAGPLERCIFNTLKVYGAVLRDNGPNMTFKAIDPGGGGQGAAAWKAVGVNLSTSGGGVLNSIGDGARMTLIPWHELEVTVPPPQT